MKYFHIVDVFSSTPFGGNQQEALGVLKEAPLLDDLTIRRSSDYSQRLWIRALFSKCGALTELWPSA